MLISFLFHIIISAACLLAGMAFYLAASGSRPVRSPVVYAITGLIILAMVSQIAVLFMPVTLPFSLVIFSMTMLVLIWKKKSFLLQVQGIRTFLNRPASFFAACAAFWLVILVFNAGPVTMDDTESYHIQMVKWIGSYGTVPGLANLHERYGFNTSWFPAIAFFKPPGLPYYTVLNGVISLWAGCYLFSLASGKQNFSMLLVSLVILAFLLVIWPMARGNAASANYDFITTVIILIMFLEAIRSGKETNDYRLEWMLWPLFLFTIRIINFPLLLLPFHVIFTNGRRPWKKQLSLFTIAAAVMIIPFLAGNFLLSGYLFYPSPQPDLFHPDWKVDPQTVDRLVDYIRYFNRVNTMHLDLEVTRQIPFPDWTAEWFRYLFRYDKWVLVPGLICFFISFAFLRRLRQSGKSIFFFMAVLLIQLISWFLVAPDPRFVYGPLLCGVAIFIFLVTDGKKIIHHANISVLALWCCALALTGYAMWKPYRADIYRNWILPAELPSPAVISHKVDGTEVYIPRKLPQNWNPRCYDTPLPCAYEIKPGLRLRGKTLSEGFRAGK